VTKGPLEGTDDFDFSQIESSREFLLTITDNMHEGMIATDAIGVVTFVNAAASRLIKIDPSELLGSSANSLFRFANFGESRGQDAGTDLSDVWTRGTRLQVDLAHALRRGHEGVAVTLTASPLLAAEGIKGSVIIFEDISAHVTEKLKVNRQLDKLVWVGRIRDAIDDQRLELFAQPIIDLSTNEIVQHELLVRLRSANGEIYPAAHFIPTAEEFGLVTEIDRWVIVETARLAARGKPVAFNLSARSVADPKTLGRIESAIRSAGAPPHLIECEITETALVGDEWAAEELVRGLIALGCSVALDDFGVGYGCFAYLKRLPVSVLKIDREFVRDLGDEASSRHVVAAVVSLAKAFAMTTTAEGPQNRQTLELLRELGVDRAQGYLIGRPVPLSEAFDDLE
jgi:PAS domain S-box-containing protein